MYLKDLICHLGSRQIKLLLGSELGGWKLRAAKRMYISLHKPKNNLLKETYKERECCLWSGSVLREAWVTGA